MTESGPNDHRYGVKATLYRYEGGLTEPLRENLGWLCVNGTVSEDIDPVPWTGIPAAVMRYFGEFNAEANGSPVIDRNPECRMSWYPDREEWLFEISAWLETDREDPMKQVVFSVKPCDGLEEAISFLNAFSTYCKFSDFDAWYHGQHGRE